MKCGNSKKIYLVGLGLFTASHREPQSYPCCFCALRELPKTSILIPYQITNPNIVFACFIIGHSSVQSPQKEQAMELYAFQVNPNTHINPALHLLKSPRNARAQFNSPKCLCQPQSNTRNPKPKTQQPTLLKSSKNAPIEEPIAVTKPKTPENAQTLESLPDVIPRWFLIGGASLGIAFLVMGFEGHKEAMALGPEGPLVEEFWDNMRRYALYALTVSTGMAYTVIQPIVELLRNPITAVLILIVIAGSGFVMSQVLNAMVGNSDFTYNYG
jgi:Protein of unknown function (DUF751)